MVSILIFGVGYIHICDGSWGKDIPGCHVVVRWFLLTLISTFYTYYDHTYVM
jgi:hypothetical protein